VAIATYDRGPVLVETLRHLFELHPKPSELLVVDQTGEHAVEVAGQLRSWHDSSRIRWIRRSEPSIPAAMNAALLAASAPVLLFLDDDVIPAKDLLDRHVRAHGSSGRRLVAGRVIQPWDDPDSPAPGGGVRELERLGDWLRLVIGANLSVDRRTALAAGGFDERFTRTAYRFEADFARRFVGAEGTVVHAPDATVHHLRSPGGTRSGPASLFAIRVRQAQGEYYFWLRTGRLRDLAVALAGRPLTAITPAHEERRWTDRLVAIPAEVLALLCALRAWWRGPRLITGDQ